jgi:hypothetical protein
MQSAALRASLHKQLRNQQTRCTGRFFDMKIFLVAPAACVYNALEMGKWLWTVKNLSKNKAATDLEHYYYILASCWTVLFNKFWGYVAVYVQLYCRWSYV